MKKISQMMVALVGALNVTNCNFGYYQPAFAAPQQVYQAGTFVTPQQMSILDRAAYNACMQVAEQVGGTFVGTTYGPVFYPKAPKVVQHQNIEFKTIRPSTGLTSSRASTGTYTGNDSDVRSTSLGESYYQWGVDFWDDFIKDPDVRV